MHGDHGVSTLAVRRSAWMTLIVLLVIVLGPSLAATGSAIVTATILPLAVSASRPCEPGRFSRLLRGPDR